VIDYAAFSDELVKIALRRQTKIIQSLVGKRLTPEGRKFQAGLKELERARKPGGASLTVGDVRAGAKDISKDVATAMKPGGTATRKPGRIAEMQGEKRKAVEGISKWHPLKRRAALKGHRAEVKKIRQQAKDFPTESIKRQKPRVAEGAFSGEHQGDMMRRVAREGESRLGRVA